GPPQTRAHEPETLPRQGPDQALLLAGIADRRAGGVHRRAERRFRDDPALPDHAPQIVPADHPVAMLDQAGDEVEDLRLDGDGAAAALELAALRAQGA